MERTTQLHKEVIDNFPYKFKAKEGKNWRKIQAAQSPGRKKLLERP